jgi:hypothetical protein
MQEILFGYKLNPTTWAYVSALMMIGTYFKFRRFWSVRNLDLIALISFSPGFLLVYHGLLTDKPDLIRDGYVWLFAVSAFFLVRLILDPVMVRRPLLEPNLSASGLTFTGISLLVFLMANVVTVPKERLEYQLAVHEAAAQTPGAKTSTLPASSDKATASQSLGYVWFYTFADLANDALVPDDPARPETREEFILAATARGVTILAHLAVVVGMVWIGYRHFDNIHTGVAAATLYLLTFYTSQLTSHIDYVGPAALLVWAVAAYRLPIVSGLLIGLAAGMIYYPLFLLPLWCAFYWRRGLVRFVFSVLLAMGILAVVLALTSPDRATFYAQLRLMIGWRNPLDTVLSGFWQYYDPAYRIPVFALFVAICGSMAIWPAQKNLGTLLSCSAAVMLATQFWHPHQGGLCMAWYLPLLILTIFRPNLEDRVAMSAVRPGWGRRKKAV